MHTETDIAARCQEFTDALTEVLAENAIGPARRGRLARAHAAVRHHPQYSEHAFCAAVETAFMQWEGLCRTLVSIDRDVARSRPISCVPATAAETGSTPTNSRRATRHRTGLQRYR